MINADHPLVHLIAPINGVDFAVDEGSILSSEVTTAGERGEAARITLVGDDAVVSSLQLRGHIVAVGEVSEDTDPTSLALYGRTAPRQRYGRYLTESEADALVADILAYSATPRGSWDILLDADRDAETMNAAADTDILDVQRVNIDANFDNQGAVVRIEHRITEAAGRLVTRLTMLAETAALAAPSFTDNTGDAQTWTAGTGITSITVPEADGTPAPTYAVQSGLPSGLAFDTTTRVISGTPSAAGSGTITIRASNSEGDADWTVDYTTSAALRAPAFSDNTGDDQTWTQNTAITNITVPAASGNPTPTYAVQGSLPAGIAFNATSRVISGTPTATSSGTITIRASNSEGHADWTVDYTTTAALALSDFDDTGLDVIALGLVTTGVQEAGTFYRSVDNGGPLGTLAAGSDLTLVTGQDITRIGVFSSGAELRIWDNPSSVSLNATFPSGTDYNVYIQTAAGLAILDRGNQTANRGIWTTTDTDEQAILASLLTTGTAFLIAVAEPAALAAPAFADDTGDDQDWTQNQAITDITVPAASGNPAPTYAVQGSLPAGIAFDTTTRVLSGIPTTAGSGTITIRATNSEGDDDWSVDYTTADPVVSVTVDLGSAALLAGIIVAWSDDVDLGATFDRDGLGQTLTQTLLYYAGANAGLVTISILGTDDRFTADFEANGLITFEASDGETLEIMIADADTSEPYTWTPSNSDEVIAFALHVGSLVDRSATLTLSLASDPSQTIPASRGT